MWKNIVIMSDMFNIYTCTEEDLTSIYDVGPASAARIIELRERVIRNEIPLLTVEDLAQIRLNRESWQQLIDENKLSIEFQTAKVKVPLVAGIGTPTQAQPPLMEAVEVDMTPPHVPITPNLGNPNLDHDTEIKAYLQLLGKSQLETNNAIKTLSKENVKMTENQNKLWAGFESVCKNQDSMLSSIDTKIELVEANLIGSSLTFQKEIKTFVNDTVTSISDLRGNLTDLIQKVDENKIKSNHDIGSVIERLDKFDFEMSRIADTLNNTQGEVTMLRSSVPPPNFQPTTPSKTAFNFPSHTPNYPGLSLPPVMSSNFGLNLPTITSSYLVTSNPANQTINPGPSNGPSAMTNTNVSAIFPDSNIVKTSNMPSISSKTEAVELITDVLKQLTANENQESKQETEIKKIIEAIPSDRKYSSKSDIQEQSNKQDNDKSENKTTEKNRKNKMNVAVVIEVYHHYPQNYPFFLVKQMDNHGKVLSPNLIGSQKGKNGQRRKNYIDYLTAYQKRR